MVSVRDYDSLSGYEQDNLIQKLSELLIGYSTSNYFIANRESEFIEDLSNYARCCELTKHTLLQPGRFISGVDIKESWLRFINEYRVLNLTENLMRCDIKKILMFDNEAEGFFFGDIRDGVLVIKYFILNPNFQGDGNGGNFFKVVLDQCLKEYKIKSMLINVGVKFADIDKIERFLRKRGFSEGDELQPKITCSEGEVVKVYVLNICN